MILWTTPTKGFARTETVLPPHQDGGVKSGEAPETLSAWPFSHGSAKKKQWFSQLEKQIRMRCECEWLGYDNWPQFLILGFMWLLPMTKNPTSFSFEIEPQTDCNDQKLRRLAAWPAVQLCVLIQQMKCWQCLSIKDTASFKESCDFCLFFCVWK